MNKYTKLGPSARPQQTYAPFQVRGNGEGIRKRVVTMTSLTFLMGYSVYSRPKLEKGGNNLLKIVIDYNPL
jgi:hypothetical protein